MIAVVMMMVVTIHLCCYYRQYSHCVDAVGGPTKSFSSSPALGPAEFVGTTMHCTNVDGTLPVESRNTAHLSIFLAACRKYKGLSVVGGGIHHHGRHGCPRILLVRSVEALALSVQTRHHREAEEWHGR